MEEDRDGRKMRVMRHKLRFGGGRMKKVDKAGGMMQDE
jgi:hypothetical protein